MIVEIKEGGMTVLEMYGESFCLNNLLPSSQFLINLERPLSSAIEVDTNDKSAWKCAKSSHLAQLMGTVLYTLDRKVNF
jgi:hypothetical protein